MFKLRVVFLLLCVGVLSSCVSHLDCKCDLPGAALIKVFEASDGKPNVNIETLTVYPGQKVVFEGLPEFSLIFSIDPRDPNKKNVKVKSKKGKISIKVAKNFKELVKERSKEFDELTVQASSNYSNDPVDYFVIKYDVEAKGKVRDPRLKVIIQ